MTDDNSKLFSDLASQLEILLNTARSEQEVHQFICDHPAILGVRERVRFGHGWVKSAISKFPVSPDRVPDFVVAELALQPVQLHSRINFIELKRSDEPLFVQHGRMSKGLNDAWIECTDTLRIVASNYRDFMRRLVRQIAATEVEKLERLFESADLPKGDPRRPNASDYWNDWMPSAACFIVMGRRSSLDSEGIHRVRELALTTSFSIQVLTYDSIIDELHEAAQRGFSTWRW